MSSTACPPLSGLLTPAERDRLLSILATRTARSEASCLNWLGGSKSRSEQYGAMRFRGKSERVHRVIVMLNGVPPPPKKAVVRHLCGNSRCVNPEHLRIGTSSENQLDTADHGHRSPDPRPLSAEDEERVRQQAAMGHSSWRIAEEWFLCRSTVMRFMQRHRLGSYERERKKTMNCNWKPNPPAVITEAQASEAMSTLRTLREAEDAIDKKYGGKIKAFELSREADKVLQFESEGDPVTFSSYGDTLVKRITEYGLNRMSIKTLNVSGVGTISRRPNPEKLSLIDGDEQIREVQSAITDRIATLLEKTTLADLLSKESRKALSKAEIEDLAAVPLLGLYRLKVEADTDSVKAGLKNGKVKPDDLSRLGYQLVDGSLRVDIKIE